MPDMLLLGRGGAINAERVTAVASAKSDPIRRLLKMLPPPQIIDLTYGFPRQSVIILDNGFVALSSRTPEELARVLHRREDELVPPWW